MFWLDLMVYIIGILAALGVLLSGALWVIEKLWPPKPRVIGCSNYTPRGDRVLVKRSEMPKPQPGTMALPASQQKPLNAGIVVAVGTGALNHVTGKLDPIEDLKPGDSVEFLDYAGAEVEVDGELYLVMRESEIHGKRS